MDLSNQIGSIAQQPLSVSGDAGSYTAQPIGDLIKADQYLANKAAAAAGKNPAGIYLQRILPPLQCDAGDD